MHPCHTNNADWLQQRPSTFCDMTPPDASIGDFGEQTHYRPRHHQGSKPESGRVSIRSFVLSQFLGSTNSCVFELKTRQARHPTTIVPN